MTAAKFLDVPRSFPTTSDNSEEREVLKEGILKRLPLNIPALVHASPLKSSDGVLYAGSKKDVWLEIDALTGAKVETMSATNDKVCPANNKNAVFVGRAEYRKAFSDMRSKNVSTRLNNAIILYDSESGILSAVVRSNISTHITLLMETFPMLCIGAPYATTTCLAYNMCEVTLNSMSISRMNKHNLQSACDLSTRT
ncbi:unnamed protein product [Cylicocyclus nassatus]|uniref:Uncharacterized protein n=1 Tax=Cylicocyclus nassatus TaxID=53992 RepID=A0AA36GFU7_CYLNA|nr:unnamed protein product [Cylicocyclus nassatus]